MPVNGYNIGRDVRLDIVTNGVAQRFSIQTRFKSSQDITEIKVKRLDGVVDNLYLPDGWKLEFEYERASPVLDSYIDLLESNYYAGVSGNPITVTETIQEADGSVTQWRYYGVVLKLDDAGDWKGDATVKQSLTGMAQRRRRIA